MTNPYGIPGLTIAGMTPPEAPMFVVYSVPKSGKSVLATTLFNWPLQGNQPLVLAFDKTGPDSCLSVGYQVAALKVDSQPGGSYFEKTRSALVTIEDVFRQRNRYPFTSIVVDCGSTMTNNFLREVKPKFAHGKQVYGQVLDRSREVMWRLIDVGVPIIWLAWIQEPFIEEDGKRKIQHMGGAAMDGSFKQLVSGRADQTMYLEKIKVGEKAPGADPQGYTRVLHTKTYNNIECHGRFSHLLPEPCPAHLGQILTAIMTPQYAQAPAPDMATAVPGVAR